MRNPASIVVGAHGARRADKGGNETSTANRAYKAKRGHDGGRGQFFVSTQYPSVVFFPPCTHDTQTLGSTHLIFEVGGLYWSAPRIELPHAHRHGLVPLDAVKRGTRHSSSRSSCAFYFPELLVFSSRLRERLGTRLVENLSCAVVRGTTQVKVLTTPGHKGMRKDESTPSGKDLSVFLQLSFRV